MLFIEQAGENKRGISKSANALTESVWQVGLISSQKQVWKTRKRKSDFRAGLKTGSEVGTFLLRVKVSPGPHGSRCLRSVVFQLP